MTFISKILNIVASSFSVDQLSQGEEVPILLPYYHLVSDKDHPFHYNYNFPSTKRFRQDLDFLLDHFDPISLEELHTGLNLRNTFHLTFDDGLRECYEIIAPILKEKGIPATFFVNPAFVDNHDLFHRYKAAVLNRFFAKKGVKTELKKTYADLLSLDQTAEDIGLKWEEYLDEEKPYMSMEQLKQMAEDGFTIGAHSWDHPEFWLLDDDHQLEEISDSMEWLVANFNPTIKAFAFPFTDFGVSDSVFDTIHRKRICDITFGTAGIKSEKIPNHFQRLPMERNGVLSAKDILREEYLAFKIKKLLGKHYTERN
ncbi:polysaccharide deacetylase family protein [Sunxiuqinia indica]|uniref:polysaccharide deacetylase family protein n=1 Tax=Sunxiuqinia indica TaxID=2692584 RepID=UPI00135B293C|nr:polysaccharide deacetylase family protein [Sunxiuqinia indica]